MMAARGLVCVLFLLDIGTLLAQTDTGVPFSSAPPASTSTPAALPAPVQPSPVSVPLNKDRILKIIPNYQTVEDSSQNVAPMTAKEKWHLAWKRVTDPFNIASAALAASWSQATGATPRYGYGREALAESFRAAIGDFGSHTALNGAAAAEARNMRRLNMDVIVIRP